MRRVQQSDPDSDSAIHLNRVGIARIIDQNVLTVLLAVELDVAAELPLIIDETHRVKAGNRNDEAEHGFIVATASVELAKGEIGSARGWSSRHLETVITADRKRPDARGELHIHGSSKRDEVVGAAGRDIREICRIVEGGVWGITASDGPGPAIRRVNGRRVRFHAYIARSIPYGPDDGTLAPWGVAASLPFAPEIVLRSLHRLNEDYPEMTSEYGFKCSYNPTFTSGDGKGWVSKGYYGLDQGPIVMMIENYRTGFIWQLMRRCPYIVDGLRRAGFRGGWLDE